MAKLEIKEININGELYDIESDLKYDDTPIEGSYNPVTSGGVYLATHKPISPIDIIKASGPDDQRITLPDGVITHIPVSLERLKVTNSLDGDMHIDRSIKAVMLPRKGIYRISGSVYISTPSGEPAYSRGCYLKAGSLGTSFANATEIASQLNFTSNTQHLRAGAVTIPPFLYSATESLMVVYLAARCQGTGRSTVVLKDNMTYLQIEYVCKLNYDSEEDLIDFDA